MTADILEPSVFLQVGDVDDFAIFENAAGRGCEGDGVIIGADAWETRVKNGVYFPRIAHSLFFD